MNHPDVVELLLKRGADDTKTLPQTVLEINAGSTALDIARCHATHDIMGRGCRAGHSSTRPHFSAQPEMLLSLTVW